MPDSALYQRVSDGTDRSVEQQNAANVAAAEARGWSHKSYSDPVSASRFSKKERPGWDALVAEVARGAVRYVVLWEPSRGDRKLSRWATFLDACRDNGVGVYITSHGRLYDLQSARDWRNLAEDGIDSAFESEKTSERSRRGVEGAAAGGEPYGRVPYGYRRTYEAVRGRARPVPSQVPDPDEAPVVREIITRIAASEAVSAILRDFAKRGVVTRAGKPWSRASVCRLVLEGVVYIGKRRHNGGPLMPGNWPAIVGEDVYWAALTVLRDPARKASALSRGGIRPGKARWLLSYIARCGACDAVLHVHMSGRPEPYYRCSASGGHAVAPVEWMDLAVSEAIIAWCARPGVYEAITGGDDAEAAAAREEARAEASRLDDFRVLAIAGKISAASFAEIAAGIEQRIAALDARADSLAVLPALRELARADRESDIRERWAGMPLAARRSVISKIAAPRVLPVADAPRGEGVRNPWRIEMGFKDRG